MLYLFAAGAFVSTLLGGFFALRLKDKLHLILGFSAGAVIGVAFFDLIPEALELASPHFETRVIVSLIALGFMLYLTIDRFIALHSHAEDNEHAHHHRGIVGASTLSLHSFLDGVGIGLAFQVSATLGLVVALAVLAHDFSDGINTVNMVLKHAGDRARAMRWLMVDAAAPVVGVLVAFFISVSESQLGLLLALFAGFFLYIGTADLLPESHHRHPVFWTTLSTIAGVALLYVVVRLAA